MRVLVQMRLRSLVQTSFNALNPRSHSSVDTGAMLMQARPQGRAFGAMPPLTFFLPLPPPPNQNILLT